MPKLVFPACKIQLSSLKKSVFTLIMLAFPIFVLSPTPLFAKYEDKINSIEMLIQVAGESCQNISYLKNAIVSYKDGDEDNALHQIYLFIEKEKYGLSMKEEEFYKKIESGGSFPDLIFSIMKDSSPSRDFIYSYYAYIYPDVIKDILLKYTGGLIRATYEVEILFNKNKTVMDSLSRGKNELFLGSIQLVRDRLVDLKESFRNIDHLKPASIVNFLKGSDYFEHILTEFFYSILTRYDTAIPRSEEISDLIIGYMRKGKITVNPTEQYEFIKREREIEIRRIYLSRENLTEASIAVGLVSFGALAIFSGGTSLTLSPFLLGALEYTSAASSVVLAGNMALNIGDRYLTSGVNGLLNIQTLFDALVLLSCMVPTTSQMMQKLTKSAAAGSRVATGIVGYRYQSGYVISGIGISYGGWMVIQAEKISQRLSENGVTISPSEIRRMGLVFMAVGVMGGVSSYNLYRTGIARNGAGFRKSMEKYMIGKTMQSAITKNVRAMLPHVQIGRLGEGVRLLSARSYKSGIAKTLGASSLLAFQAMEYSTMAIAANSYPAFMLINKAFVDDISLRDGESAVTLIGFEKNDILYYYAHSDLINRVENKKFGTIYRYDFESPDDFLLKLRNHAKVYGRIKYLKIQTHGMPGLLFSSAAGGVEYKGEAAGFISKGWILENLNRIKSIASDVFAKDAAIVFVSCLVGANLEKEIDASGIHLDQNMGDEFLDAFGDAFLVNGGTMYASTRMVLLTGVYLDAFAKLSLSFFSDEKREEQFINDIDKLMVDINTLNLYLESQLSKDPRLYVPHISDEDPQVDENSNLFDQNSKSYDDRTGAQTKSIEIVKTMMLRIVNIYKNIPLILYKYCYNIEGNFFTDRVKEKKISAH